MTEPLLDAPVDDSPEARWPSAAAAAEPPRNIYDLLRARHAAPEWAFLKEVGDRPAGGRWADGIPRRAEPRYGRLGIIAPWPICGSLSLACAC